MPNTGKPSKDCHTCRKRRVKCTLERPECQRCIRIGSKCPGYRDEQDLMFRNEDISSLGGSSAKRDRRRARSNNSSDRESSSGTTPELSTPPQVSVPCDWSFRGIKLRDLDPIVLNDVPPSSICPIPPTQWSHYAVPLVLALFSFEVEGQRVFTQFQVLANLLLRCPDYSPLALCCEALGIAYLANRFRSVEANTMRDQAYIRALAATNILVGDPDLCQQDEASISVWLLSLYEVVTGSQHLTDGSSTITWGIHAQGSVELLRLRGQNQLDSPAGRSVFFMLAASTQIRTLITAEDYPAFIQDWMLAARDQLTGSGLDFFYMSSFAYQVAGIATEAREAVDTDDTHFLAWTTTELWNRLTDLQQTLNQAMHGYPLGEPVNLDNLHLSNQYQTFYLRALQYMVELVESRQLTNGSGLPSEQLAGISMSIRSMIQSLVDGILSNASIVLNSKLSGRSRRSPVRRNSLNCQRPIFWCDVLKLVWPLRIVGAREQLLRGSQLESTQAMLRCLSDDFCIRQAVAVYHPLDISPGR